MRGKSNVITKLRKKYNALFSKHNSNGLYFLTLPLVSVMRVIYRKIRHVRYLYIKRNVEKVWGARYTLGVRYLLKNTVIRSVLK